MSRSLLVGNKLPLSEALHAYVSRLFSRRIAPDCVSAALCKQPGIAAVEDVEIMAGSATGPRISALVVVALDTPNPDCVVRCAAESLRKELCADEVMLDYKDDLGRRRGILVAGLA